MSDIMLSQGCTSNKVPLLAKGAIMPDRCSGVSGLQAALDLDLGADKSRRAKGFSAYSHPISKTEMSTTQCTTPGA